LNATRSFVYDAVGNLVKRTVRNGWVTYFSYDNLHRQTQEVWSSAETPTATVAQALDQVFTENGSA
jgi:YD repeat-containing protein